MSSLPAVTGPSAFLLRIIMLLENYCGQHEMFLVFVFWLFFCLWKSSSVLYGC